MNFKLKVSENTSEKLKSLHSSTNLTPNILARIAVGFSLRIDDEPEVNDDNSGLEFNRNTLTGENDYVYKALITQHCKRDVSDQEYFPKLFKSHLERGITILENEYKHAGNAEKFMNNLLKT